MMNVVTLTVQEDEKLDAMQKMWQNGRRMLSSDALFPDCATLSVTLCQPAKPQVVKDVSKTTCSTIAAPASFTCSDIESDSESVDFSVNELPRQTLARKPVILDASTLGDIPARYTIPALAPHQFPVVGVYIDRRVTPGFKYRVRPLPSLSQYYQRDITELPYMFNEKALSLKSIGRGYARRITFAGETLSKDNVFWSDSQPDGFCFELEVVSVGDKFTVYDTNEESQGTLEVLQIEQPQLETASKVTKDGVEKRARVNFTGKVEYYETGVAKPMLFSGTAVVLKPKHGGVARIVKIINTTINKKRKGFTLTPGIQKDVRRVTVRGEDINDVPTKYTMTGLQPYELPVVGTYVDPRIVVGFYYKVRPNDRKDHLFQGRSLKLTSIGMGYAKKLTFQPDSLTDPNNFLWSDNHPDGLGLEPRAVRKGMKFTIRAQGRELGKATVFRADMPQIEEKMEMVPTMSRRMAIVKYIHVNVTCHIRLATTNGGPVDNEDHLMRVYGLAVVRKNPEDAEAKIVRVENVGLDSQLNLIFARSHQELVFLPQNGRKHATYSED